MIDSRTDIFPGNVDTSTWFNPEYLNFQRPEVAKFLGGLSFNPEITNTIITVEQARDLLLEGGFEHGAELELPIVDGIIDPAKLSEVVTERVAERDEVLLPGLSEFRYRYATVNGATEGIDQLMVGLSAAKTMKKAGLIRGDYLGYLGAALSKGIEVQWADSLEEVGEPEDGVVWFVSNPSAISGNVCTPNIWQAFIDAGHRVVLDAAYVDLTLEGDAVSVDSENIIAIITSPSKPYGVVFDKYPGVVYTRKRHDGLDLQKKFNNVPRLFTILEIQSEEEFGPHKIAGLHHPTQLAICQDMSKAADGEVLPSDATLMAYAKGELHQDYDRYRTVNLHERPIDYTFRLTREFARRALLGSQQTTQTC
jgi:hypothetical protein